MKFEPWICTYKAENGYSLEMFLRRSSTRKMTKLEHENPDYEFRVSCVVKDPKGDVLSLERMYAMQKSGEDDCFSELKSKFLEAYKVLEENGLGSDVSRKTTPGIHFYYDSSDDSFTMPITDDQYTGIPAYYCIKGGPSIERDEARFVRILNDAGFAEPKYVQGLS